MQVRNRTQEEINSNITAEQALKNEQDFFQGNNLQPEQLAVSMELRSLSKDKKGTIQLIKKLVEIQQEQIRKQMPGVRRKVGAVHWFVTCALSTTWTYTFCC